MFFEEIGTLPLRTIKLNPDFESNADGSMMAFDIEGSDARLLVSSISDRVILCTKRGEEKVTYRGVAADEELDELKNQFFGGSTNV